MRGLAGDVATMPLQDLVVYLGNRRATGLLHFEQAGTEKQVLLRDGHVVSASSNQPREYFGQFLINTGHLSEDQLARAFATQRQTNVFLGKILAMIGLVSEEVVGDILRLKFRETLLEAFGWREGTFTFEPTEQPPAFDGLDVQVSLLDIHREADFREAAWAAIRSVFPSGAVRLGVDESKLPEPVRPGSLDERLLGLIREGLTIEDIALTLHASDFFLYQRLYALYKLEAVRVEAEEPVALGEPSEELSIGTESPVGEVVQAARNFLSQGNLRDGEALARRAHEMEPSTQTSELLQSAERSLLMHLRQQLVERALVPELLVPPAHVKTLQLTSPERYLLSRIDGRRDVAAIIHVSPLRELDALKFFQNFVDSQLVKLTGRY
jgi:hypothetical protein